MDKYLIYYVLIPCFLIAITLVLRTTIKENKDIIEYEILKQHLLHKSTIVKVKKPIMWIPIPFHMNSRKWEDFGSRNTMELNLDLLYLTTKSIIEKCGESFHIVLIDNESYSKLIPGWNVDLNMIPSPLKEQYVFLAQMKLLSIYGGMLIPPSFVCTSDLYEIFYDKCIFRKTISYANLPDGMPSISFVCSHKDNPNMDSIVSDLEQLVSANTTNEIWFSKSINNLFQSNQHTEKLSGSYIGTQTSSGKNVVIDELFQTQLLDFGLNNFGLYLPLQLLMKRTHYNYIIYLSVEELKNMNNFMGSYLQSC